MLSKDDIGVIEELRGVLSKINGVSKFTEIVSLSYILEVGTQEDKLAVEKVGNLLTEQATKYNIDLEITAATSEELAEAKKMYDEHVNAKQQTSFVFDIQS